MILLRTSSTTELLLNKCFPSKRNIFVDLAAFFILSSKGLKHKTAILKILLSCKIKPKNSFS